MPFELNTAQLFLTYPKCPIPKEEARDWLIQKFDPNYYVVAQEKHADGDPHLHVYMKLKKAVHVRNHNYYDLPGPYHGKYEGCRSVRKVIQYCTKEEDYVANFDVTANQKTNLRKRLFQELVDGDKTVIEAVDEDPTLLKGYRGLCADYEKFKQDKRVRREPIPTKIENPWGFDIELFGLKNDNIWFFSRVPDKGKTTGFALPFVKKYEAELITGCPFYWNVLKETGALVIDEYNKCFFDMAMLNQVCDGTYLYRVIYQGSIRLEKPLIIILSNKHPEELYKPSEMPFINARFRIYEIL